MALGAGARVQAIYNALAAQPRNDPLTGKQMVDATGAPIRMLDGMSPTETKSLMSNLTALFGTDTGYLVANAVVVPGTMATPPGALVQVAYPAGSGSVTGASPTITGAGKLT